MGDKLRKEAGQEGQLALVQLSKSPAHYVVQVADKQLDVGGGRNNRLHGAVTLIDNKRSVASATKRNTSHN